MIEVTIGSFCIYLLILCKRKNICLAHHRFCHEIALHASKRGKRERGMLSELRL
jgi:hypothetical protein